MAQEASNNSFFGLCFFLGGKISWKKRWFVFDRKLRALCYYQDERKTMSKGILYLIATPIGNLEDITFRAIRLLGNVSLIAAEDTRRTAKLLNRYKIVTPTISLHEHNEKQRTPSLIKRLEAGQSIALVTDAGTPLLSDPGLHLVRTAVERGLQIDPVPGASAILAALTVAGLVENQFTFLGFPPNRSINPAQIRYPAIEAIMLIAVKIDIVVYVKRRCSNM